MAQDNPDQYMLRTLPFEDVVGILAKDPVTREHYVVGVPAQPNGRTGAGYLLSAAGGAVAAPVFANLEHIREKYQARRDIAHARADGHIGTIGQQTFDVAYQPDLLGPRTDAGLALMGALALTAMYRMFKR